MRKPFFLHMRKQRRTSASQLISAPCFRYMDSTILVCVRPGRKPRRSFSCDVAHLLAEVTYCKFTGTPCRGFKMEETI